MPETHGTSWLETAKDKLVTKINALLTSMIADSISPLYSFVYEQHAVAKVELNAVTIDLDSVDGGEPVGTNDKFLRWLPVYSVRVHTAYEGGKQDGQKQMRLLNSIAEKLHLKHDLADGYRIQMIDDLTVMEEFAETDTNGGHLNVQIEANVEYIQE